MQYVIGPKQLLPTMQDTEILTHTHTQTCTHTIITRHSQINIFLSFAFLKTIFIFFTVKVKIN